MSPDRPAVLLINGDPYSIRACLANGFAPVSVNSPNLRDWGYIELSDDVEVILAEDPSSFESVLSSLERRGVAESRFVCVHSADEMALTVAASLGKVLGVPAMDPRVAVRFRDKWLQKKAVSAAGIDAAASHLIEDIRYINVENIPEFGKAVLKPVAGGATRNTSVIHSRDELVARCAEYRERGVPERTFVLEEFIAGDEWAIDGIIFDGRLQFMSVCAYAEPCLDTLKSNTALGIGTETFDPVVDPEVYALAQPMAEAALRALGLTHAVFHMEAFFQRDAGRLVFGECGGRPGGGLTQEVVQHKYGVDLSEAALLCTAGIDPQVKMSTRPGVVGSTILTNRTGTLIRYPSEADALEQPGVQYARFERPFGFVVGSRVDTTQGMGQVMLTGSTPEEFRARRDTFGRWFDERTLIAPAKPTVRELRAWQEEHWPESISRFVTYPR